MKRTFCFLLLFTGIYLSAQNIGNEPGGGIVYRFIFNTDQIS